MARLVIKDFFVTRLHGKLEGRKEELDKRGETGWVVMNFKLVPIINLLFRCYVAPTEPLEPWILYVF